MSDLPRDVISIGQAARGVVVNLAERRLVMSQLESTLEQLKSMAIEQAKQKINDGLRTIQKEAGPQAAVDYLTSTLAAISGGPCND